MVANLVGSEGILMSAEAIGSFCDKGGVTGVIQPLDGLSELQTRLNPSPNFYSLSWL